MLKRSVSFLLAIALVMSCLCLNLQTAGAAGDIAANRTASNGRPYYIMVNRTANTVTIYGLDAQGYYTVPVKAMVCSVGRDGRRTPSGSFSVTGYKQLWLHMVDGSYGQYATQFYGNYLFHSVCYSKADPSTLMTDEYNMLGGPASLGCVRLQTADAKWIYDNCAAGTKVTIYDSEDPGPLGKPGTVVSEITPELDNGWDPTDPRADNPWRSILVTGVALEEKELNLTAGDGYKLTAAVSPSGAAVPAAVWSSSDPAVVSVDRTGSVAALREGTAIITIACGEVSASCTVSVTGQVLPFTDIAPGAWYYGDVRYAYEGGFLSGDGESTFSPGDPSSYAMVVQALYQMSGDGEDAGAGQEEEVWYSAAFRWAAEAGLLDGITEDGFDPNGPISRQELAVLLYRYETAVCGRPADGSALLSEFSDGGDVYSLARDAVSWAVGNGLIRGTAENRLQPMDHANRAQTAAILHRYDLMRTQSFGNR